MQWGFRRCEDICWVKTNKTNATPGLRHDSHTLFQHSKVGCDFALHYEDLHHLPVPLAFVVCCFVNAAIIFLNCLVPCYCDEGTLLDGH